MPPLAASKSPVRDVFASVKVPRSWPKSSASTSDAGIAVQFTSMKGPSPRRVWIARATMPLPVPVSPVIRIAGRLPGGRPASRKRSICAKSASEARIATDHAVRRGALAIAQVGELALLPRPRQHALDEQRELVEVERLLEVVRGAAAHRLDGVLHRSVGGHQDDREARRLGLDVAEHVETRAVGQPQIEQHEIRGIAAQRLESPGAVRRGAHLVPARFERARELAARAAARPR